MRGNPKPTVSAQRLKEKLEAYPAFGEYKVILAVGDGSGNDDGSSTKAAIERVREAIGQYDKTITLSVGQLTTGVTVPEWTGVLMLSNMQSSSLYIQAAFRAQNPCLFNDGHGQFRRKENAYVFDFDPARTLTIYGDFANGLYSETAGGAGTMDDRKRNVKRLLNFFPVLGEDEDGEVEVPRDTVVGTAQDIFGEKVYGDAADDLEGVATNLQAGAKPTDKDLELDRLMETFASHVADPIMRTAVEYTSDLKPAQRKRVETKLKAEAAGIVGREVGSYKAERNRIDLDERKALEQVSSPAERQQITIEYDGRRQEAMQSLKASLMDVREDMVQHAGETVVEAVETAKRETKKAALEDEIRHHLDGFARTIPSFLMAYGDETTTLATFDATVPADVFEEVTRNTSTGECITLDMFRLFRDGGDVTNPKTGATEHFAGNLFDEVVFDDLLREFLRMRRELADYFDLTHGHVIFDYIPPQRTNQIFTTRRVVRQMVDLFEQENPGCFDDPDHTFADLYMKSGLFITEIVTRLYNSPRMQELYPDRDDRLLHIFERQVFGAAPIKILYAITTNFIFGFAEDADAMNENFVCADTAELAK